MSKTRSPTTDNRPKPNANALRKHSLPAQFGSMTDSFQVGDPGGATKTADKGDDKRLGKSLNGASLDESKLASTVRPSPAQARTVPITDACQPRGRPPSSATLPALIDTRSYRAAVKCTPPSSPVAPPSLLLPPITNTSKPIMPAWSPATPQRPKLDTDTSSFPPLSPVPSSSKPSTSTGTKSYAKCFEPASTTTPVLERQVQNQEMP
ncbi:hypothetical protein FS749_001123 [Ceratobasidium sp. UAMH 11750]|nr:hypothetical protein FS749_001123 [Ceratobasidium sp. UAMH 11750]